MNAEEYFDYILTKFPGKEVPQTVLLYPTSKKESWLRAVEADDLENPDSKLVGLDLDPLRNEVVRFLNHERAWYAAINTLDAHQRRVIEEDALLAERNIREDHPNKSRFEARSDARLPLYPKIHSMMDANYYRRSR